MARTVTFRPARLLMPAMLAIAAVGLPSLAHADYWERRAKVRDAADLAGGVIGVIGAAAEADREARARNCWTEERRARTGGKVVIKRVQVCE